jgi:SAM-dependent methyltransferase
LFQNTAHIYDLLYQAAGKDYAAEATRLHELIQARRPGANSLLDVACGTGAHLVALHQWYEVAGVDVDAGMLEQARAKLPGASFVEADMRHFDLGRRFDAVTCLFSAIAYMPTVEDLNVAIAKMAAHLNPGGVLVADGWVRPEAWREPSIHSLTARAEDGTVAVRVGLSRREGNRTHLEMHHLVATPERIDHLVDHHDLTLFTDAEYTAALHSAGLEPEALDSSMPDRDLYVGTKPSP